MKLQNTSVDQRGVIHHLGLLIFVVAVFAAVGFAGYRVYNNSQTGEDSAISVQSDDSFLADQLDDESAALLLSIDELESSDKDGDQ